LARKKSSSHLIQYLVSKSSDENLSITIGDIDPEATKKRLSGFESQITILQLDIFDEKSRSVAIEHSDLVISMLPARLHTEVAKDCLKYKKHMVTASYVSKEMQALDEEARTSKLIFMNEMGVDPGIDHMSAMQVIDRIKNKGGKILLFESFTGGLVAPESDDNLWHYKFTWNPRNVVLAGQGGAAKFIPGKAI
jgi:saccharopine dehydrogenase-like NADP-dependent oxidoreductase